MVIEVNNRSVVLDPHKNHTTTGKETVLEQSLTSCEVYCIRNTSTYIKNLLRIRKCIMDRSGHEL